MCRGPGLGYGSPLLQAGHQRPVTAEVGDGEPRVRSCTSERAAGPFSAPLMATCSPALLQIPERVRNQGYHR